MATDESFESAQARVKTLSRRPSDQELLQIYALYKQGTAGDVSGKRPGMLSLKDRAKYDAWAELRGTAGEEARRRYVALVDGLVEKYG